MESFNINCLNDEQQKALVETEGAILVTAGAGSGKTRLLTHRVAFLISRGVDPYNILAITFTNKATKEMETRVKKMCDNSGQIWISTFHAMCAKILRIDIDKLGYQPSFTIYAEDDSEKIVKEILKDRLLAEDKWKKTVLFHISNWKNSVLSLNEYKLLNSEVENISKIISIIEEYESRLKKNNALDFDDLLIKTYNLFSNFEEVRYKYANRFKYILVDEFQDTNSVQYELLKQLSSVHGNIFVVGDEDQCIYSWRGANFKNIFNFKKDFNNVKIFKLERNYRSTSKILDKANMLISHNCSRLNKKLWTENIGGDEPVIYNAVDERDEALFVASNIDRMIGMGDKPSDFAVLMRMNALSRNLEEAFLSYNIPHRIFGGYKFYERAEIKLIISYLRLFVNPNDDVAFLKVINSPRRGIGDSAIENLKDVAGSQSLLFTVLHNFACLKPQFIKKFQDFIEIFNELSNLQVGLSDFVTEVINKFKIRDIYNKQTEEGFDKLMNISSFEAAVREFDKLNIDAGLSDFLESITLSVDTDEIGEGGCVTIATVHAVKGLEFKTVFIVGLEEGIFPILRSTSVSDIEEERRLLYVAITRAQKKVFLSHCSKRFLYGNSSYQNPSRFCKELGYYQFNPRTIDENNIINSGFSFAENKSYVFNKSKFLTSTKNEAQAKDVSIYSIGQKVKHPKFGEGLIKFISDDGLVGDIDFDGFGVKSLMLDIAPLVILED